MRRMGAFAGGGLLIGGVPAGLALAQGSSTSTSDVDILNYALTLEYLEASFYAQANAGGALSGETATFSQVVEGHENAHVAALAQALGSSAIKKPQFDFKGTTSNLSSFQQTSLALENTGVEAYLGQVGNITSKTILAAAGSILPVEARHAAWIADIVGRGGNPSPAPDAFQPSATMAQVLQIVKGTGFLVSTGTAAPSGAQSGAPGLTG